MKKNLSSKIEDRLLATHIAENADFEKACTLGDAVKIREIVESEMQKHNLFTKGSQKLREDINRLLQGRTVVSSAVGTNILLFVWNSRMSGIGLGVHN